MTQRPEPQEAAPYYFRYIDQVIAGDSLIEMERQLSDGPALFNSISEEMSLHRYAPDKWTIREVLNHINDCERVLVFRAFWVARTFDSPLPSFDQNTSAAAAGAAQISWAQHVEEFRRIRLATISFFRNLPEDAWMRSGVASGNSFTVRALAYIVAGHFNYHIQILKEKYLLWSAPRHS